jgi:hypothetical protein
MLNVVYRESGYIEDKSYNIHSSIALLSDTSPDHIQLRRKTSQLHTIVPQRIPFRITSIDQEREIYTNQSEISEIPDHVQQNRMLTGLSDSGELGMTPRHQLVL